MNTYEMIEEIMKNKDKKFRIIGYNGCYCYVDTYYYDEDYCCPDCIIIHVDEEKEEDRPFTINEITIGHKWKEIIEDEVPTKGTPQLTLVEARDIDGNDWNLVEFIAIDEKSGLFICKELYSDAFIPYKGYKYCRIHQHIDVD